MSHVRFSCPSYVARLSESEGGASSDRFDAMRHASSQAMPMFQRFREDGMFVGRDAYHCCFEHPDRGLRGALKVSVRTWHAFVIGASFGRNSFHDTTANTIQI